MQDYTSYIARIESTHKHIYWNMPFESTRTEVSRGTGFFIEVDNSNPVFDEDGNVGRFMVTCAHVVQNTDFGSLRVVLANDLDRRYTAATVLTCPDIDIAVIMVFIPTIFQVNCFKIGNSDTLESNQNRSVTAVGFPLGGGIKVSQGVFSGIARGKGIQHTSPISPGSSGCPLLNADNEVVGVNHQGEVATTVSNIHYAVPINLAVVVIHDAIRAKKILYRIPLLGVCFHNTSKAMLRHIYRTAEHEKGQISEGVVVYRFQKKCVEMLLEMNPGHKDLITKHLGDGNKLKSTSFFLTNIHWQQTKTSNSKRFTNAIKGLNTLRSSPVDMNGLVNVAWTKQKIPLETLLRLIPKWFTIELEGFFDPIHSVSNSIRLKCRKHYYNEGVLKKLHYPFFDAPVNKLEDTYLCFMGMCVVKLNRNHYEYLQDRMCVPNYSSSKKRFVVVKVFDQSTLADSRVIHEGDELECFVSKEGDIPIDFENMIEFKREVCRLIKKDDSIGIKNKSNRWFHMNSKSMLRQEQLFESRRVYVPDTSLIQALNESVFGMGAKKLSEDVTPKTKETNFTKQQVNRGEQLTQKDFIQSPSQKTANIIQTGSENIPKPKTNKDPKFTNKPESSSKGSLNSPIHNKNTSDTVTQTGSAKSAKPKQKFATNVLNTPTQTDADNFNVSSIDISKIANKLPLSPNNISKDSTLFSSYINYSM